MTKDRYVAIVKTVLQKEPAITLYESHLQKLNALGRRVAGGEDPVATLSELENIFRPFIGRKLREALEQALK